MRGPALVAAALLLSLASGCARDKPPPAAAEVARKPATPPEQNLLAVARGAVIVARSGELSFEHSALDAIDGDIDSFWVTPPHDLRQWMVIRLPVPSRIHALGAVFPQGDRNPSIPEAVLFELSSDALSFHPVLTVQPRMGGETLLPITPEQAGFVRVTITSSAKDASVLALPDLVATGEETSSWSPPDLTGSWLLNGTEGRFQQNGTTVRGVVAMTPEMHLEGGWEGRILRLAWIRGKQRGVAFISASPDHLVGMWWFEKALPLFVGAPWFGEKTSGQSSVAESGVTEAYLSQAGRAPLYQATFREDGSVGDSSVAGAVIKAVTSGGRRIRLESFDHRTDSVAANQVSSRKRIASFIAALLAGGLDGRLIEAAAPGEKDPDGAWSTPLQRALYSRIDLVVKH